MLTIRQPAFNLEGRARVMCDLCALERHGHQHMLDELELLLEDVPLTPDQARAVMAEMEARRRLLKDVARSMKAGRMAVWVCQHRARAAAVSGRSSEGGAPRIPPA